MNKRGSISIETIVIIILALLVLVIVAASFSGGMKSLWDKIRGITPETEVTLSDATSNCNDICGTNKLAFCTTSYSIKDVGPRFCKSLVTCEGATC